MKKIVFVFLISFLLLGCQKKDESMKDVQENIVEDVKEETQNITHNLEDMLQDFKNQGIVLDSFENIEHTGLNAHEAKVIELNDTKAYLYRLNTSDQQMQQLIDHVKQTGSADVMIQDEKKQYEAVVNGDVLLLYEKDSNLKELRNVFEKYQLSPTNPSNESN